MNMEIFKLNLYLYTKMLYQIDILFSLYFENEFIQIWK